MVVGEELALFVIYAYEDSACCAVYFTFRVDVFERDIMVAGVRACDIDTVAVGSIFAGVYVEVKVSVAAF